PQDAGDGARGGPGAARTRDEGGTKLIRSGRENMGAATCLANATVVDVARGVTVPGRWVVLSDGRIDAVLDRPPGPRRFAGQVHDATGLYLCPGLIDCHVHFFLDAGPSPRVTYIESDDATKMAWARRNAGTAIGAGITTMRDCGAPGPLMFEFQR